MFSRRPPPPPSTPAWLMTLMTVGGGAGAMMAILAFLAYCAPVMTNIMTSDKPPLEGRLEHEKDMVDHTEQILKQMVPINKAANDAAEAATKAIDAAKNSLSLAQSVQTSSEQADLCRNVDRLNNTDTLLKMDPGSTVLLEFRRSRVAEIARIRKKFEMSGVIPEC